MQMPKGQTNFSPGSKMPTNTKPTKNIPIYVHIICLMLEVSLLITADESRIVIYHVNNSDEENPWNYISKIINQ